MQAISRIAAAALAVIACGSVTGAVAQVPSVISPGYVVDTFESIAVLPDVDAIQTGGTVARRIYTVPAGRTFRLTDLSVDTRSANTSPNPCFFEVWRGTELAPTTLAWSRVRVFNTATYDRSWVTGPQFAAGESLWVIGRFDPLNAGLRICTRVDVNTPTELRYALRGYLVRQLASN